MTSAHPRPGLARRLATNTLHSSTGRIASLLAWMFLTPPILHALGTEGFAVWSLFFAVTGYFSALDFGLAWGTVRHVAAARERGEAGSGGGFATLAMVGYGVLAVPLLLLALLCRDPLLDWMRIPDAARAATGFVLLAGPLVFVCSGLANVTIAALQGCNRFDLANQVSLIVVTEQAIGIPLVLHAGWGLRGLVVNVGIGWLCGLLFGVWRLMTSVPEFRWESPRAAARHTRETLRFGGPMQLTNLFAVLHSQVDKFLLPRFAGLAAVTPFELGMRVVVAAAAPAQLLVSAVLPVAAEFHTAEAHARLHDLHIRARRYVLVIGFVSMAVLMGLADRLLITWLGTGHPEAALAMRGLAAGIGLSFTTNVAAIVARGIGRTDLEAWFTGAVFAIHLGLSVVLIPVFGLAGAPAAILVANLVGSVLIIAMLSRALGWSALPLILEPLGIPLLAAVAGASVSWGLDRMLPRAGGGIAWLELVLLAASGTAAAAAVVFGSGYLRLGELRDMLSRRGARG